MRSKLPHLPFGPQIPSEPHDPNAKPSEKSDKAKQMAELAKKVAEAEKKAAEEAKKQQQSQNDQDRAKDNDQPEQSRQRATLPRDSSTQSPRDQNQTQNRKAEISHFEGEHHDFQSARRPQQMGHQTNVQNRMLNLKNTPQNRGTKLPRGEQNQNESQRQNQNQKPFPQRPKASAYQNILSQKVFRGPLSGTNITKKLQQNALRQQQAQTQSSNVLEDGDTLTRSELGTLFRMRHNTQDRKSMREVLRYELARLKAAQRAKRVNEVGQRADRQRQQNKAQMDASQVDANKVDISKQKISARLQQSASSKFEQTLQKVLERGKTMVPDLPEGVRARFAAKTDDGWNQFFKNVSNMNSSQVSDKIRLASLIEAVFRGIFTKEGSDQKMMVLDLALSEDGEVLENKYSQLPLKNIKLAQTLKQLTPGDVLNPELLEQLGKELDVLKLVHLTQILQATEEERKEWLKNFQRQSSRESQEHVEKLLARQREHERQGREQPFVHASIQPKETTRHPGNSKLFLYVFYAVAGFAFVFGMIEIIRTFF
ncbi:MAG: hypothetical protein H7A33_02245 [Deltaproteobacteria bacterium]|nr:hypothetical protein [Deltaproteobacteria bacterium]